MTTLHGVLLGLALLATGCATRESTRRDLQRALTEDRIHAEAEKKLKEPAVWFRGDIRNPRVSWREGLTLAQALAEAQFTHDWNPRLISVTRDGQVYPVNTRRLLRGQDNPELLPGDIIEVRR